jgi:small subunit ribosomal protein S17
MRAEEEKNEMADEQNDETTETPAQEAAPEADAPATPEAQAASEAEAPPAAPEPEATAEAETAPEAAPEPEATSEPEATEEPAPAPAAPAAPAEPTPQLSSKERRRLARSTHSGTARDPRSAEERRAERRKKAAARRMRRLRERAKARERRASTPASEPLPPVHAAVEGVRKTRQGIVVSDRADKTITVRIDVARRHRRYEKIVRSSSTLHAHDENNEAHEGDVVRVIESRPLSRSKRWRLVEVLERAR